MNAILIIVSIGVLFGILAVALFVSFLVLQKDDAKNIDVYDYEIFENKKWKKYEKRNKI